MIDFTWMSAINKPSMPLNTNIYRPFLSLAGPLFVVLIVKVTVIIRLVYKVKETFIILLLPHAAIPCSKHLCTTSVYFKLEISNNPTRNVND